MGRLRIEVLAAVRKGRGERRGAEDHVSLTQRDTARTTSQRVSDPFMLLRAVYFYLKYYA